MKHLRHMIGPRARRFHGGLAALYVLGMLVTVGHLALEDHHGVLAHHHHHDHAHTTAVAGAHAGHAHGLAPTATTSCEHSCCHLIHDTLPSQRPRTVQARTPRTGGLVLALPPTTDGQPAATAPRRVHADDDPPDPLAGDVSVAPERAPPAALHA